MMNVPTTGSAIEGACEQEKEKSDKSWSCSPCFLFSLAPPGEKDGTDPVASRGRNPYDPEGEPAKPKVSDDHAYPPRGPVRSSTSSGSQPMLRVPSPTQFLDLERLGKYSYL